MLASIVIVTFGQRAVTERCLHSLERALGDRLGSEIELILVDNASADDTPLLLESWSDRATVLLLAENRNFAGGCNAGAAVARGETLLFLNNDTDVCSGVLPELAEQALEPGVAAAGCRLLFPDGTIQHAGVMFLHHPSFGAAMPQHILHHQDGELAAALGSWETDCVTAACLAVRTESFRAVGGFDEGFRNGLEDVDLCLRLRVAGGTIVYRGDLALVHHEGTSRGQGEQLWSSPERLAAMRHNDERFLARWRTHLDQDDAAAASLWDAGLRFTTPPRSGDPANLALAGQPGGVGPAAAEARGLLEALQSAGHTVAAADAPPPMLVPRLEEPVRSLLQQAQLRVPQPGSPCILVPAGTAGPQIDADGAIVRIAQAPRADAAGRASAVQRAAAVWATCGAVAGALVDGGLPTARIHVVPPPVPSVPVGAGGQGILAVLPVHDRRTTREILGTLRRLGTSLPIRVLPTAPVRGLADVLSDLAPGAELLGPCGDERRFAQIAATADVVLDADSSDPFERRALLAAATGAATVTLRDAGPAADFGGALVVRPAELAVTLGGLAVPGSDRGARSRTVQESCGHGAFARAVAATLPAVPHNLTAAAC